jgi:hypothetical protein
MAVQTNELAAGVVQYIESKKVWDGLAKRTALMNHLMGAGKQKQEGGLLVQFPIKLIANTAQAFISGTAATVTANPSAQMQYGTLNWKYANYNVNFSLADLNICTGEEMMVNILTEKTKGALNDFTRLLSSAIHGSSASAPLQPEGLKDVVAASATAYASLTDTDYATGAYLSYIATDATLNYSNISKLVTKAKARSQQEISATNFLGLMNEASWNRFKASVQNQQIFTEASQFKSGAEGFRVDGCDFSLDADCPGTQDGSTGDNFVYVFPTDVMKLYYNFGFGNKSPFDGEVQIPLQPIMSTQHYCSFNLVCTNRRLVSVNKVFVA